MIGVLPIATLEQDTYTTTAEVVGPLADTCMFPGQVMFGGITFVTSTRKLHEDDRLALSKAMHVTMVVVEVKN